MLSCEFCKIAKNTFFKEHLRTTASEMNHSCMILVKKYLVTEINAVRCYTNPDLKVNLTWYISKCPYSELFWLVRIFPTFGLNTNQNNSEYGHFLQSMYLADQLKIFSQLIVTAFIFS